ncbi:unnamed protein product [Rotaria sp. Silwood1]|nr:unnamed protein product [Rotaria sp. Silwood1]CAF1565241.1 unnamed protein product [Rotaria sp. Silwood1]CAF1570556.1 unnamed protein product [Rotaria sp. Silwood1]CAF3741218.1 unnamed protein product [Rotaria sp. Silwood1]CAF4651761.1 unnamed protein product [Rotaria sp. Silwood1]
MSSAEVDLGRRKAPTCHALKIYGDDLIVNVQIENFNPVIGRDKEIRQIIEVLSGSIKNNIILVGEAGVGKTSIVKGLAHFIIEQDIPDTLPQRLITLNIKELINNGNHLDEFEKRFISVLKEIKSLNGEIILFVDEIHLVVHAKDTMDSTKLFKSMLIDGEFRCIGATTIDKYKTYIEEDPVFEKYFQQVLVKEISVDDCVSILRSVKDRCESHFGVQILDTTLVNAAKLSSRYIKNQFLPNKAFYLINEACLMACQRANSQPKLIDQLEYEKLQLNVEATKISEEKKSTLPSDMEYETIPNLEKRIVEKQDKITEENKQEEDRLLNIIVQPNIIFEIGPIGVGKTELAKILALGLFGSIESINHINMNKYIESHSTANLIHIKQDNVVCGKLIEDVQNQLYNVILFDEVEKGHPQILDIILKILNGDCLINEKGQIIDFTNTIIILSTSIDAQYKSKQVKNVIYSKKNSDEELSQAIKDHLMEKVRLHFRSEFLNRLDAIVFFQPLYFNELSSVIHLQLQSIGERFKEQYITFALTDEAIQSILKRSYNPAYGVQSLKTYLEQHIINKLSTLLTRTEIPSHCHVTIDTGANDSYKFDIQQSLTTSSTSHLNIKN